MKPNNLILALLTKFCNFLLEVYLVESKTLQKYYFFELAMCRKRLCKFYLFILFYLFYENTKTYELLLNLIRVKSTWLWVWYKSGVVLLFKKYLFSELILNVFKAKDIWELCVLTTIYEIIFDNYGKVCYILFLVTIFCAKHQQIFEELAINTISQWRSIFLP